MLLKVKNSAIFFNIHGTDNFRESINFQVVSEGRNRITIADKYEFGGKFPDKEKEQISGRFRLTKFDAHYAEFHKLDNKKIGVLDFFEGTVDEFSAYSTPTFVEFKVWVQDDEYERIKQAILSQTPISHLTCGLDGLEYGWEPDGSTQIWKLKEGVENKFRLPLEEAYITDFSIGFGKAFDDEYWEGRDEPEENSVVKKESPIKAWLEENGWFTAVMLLIIAYMIFK